MPPRHPIPTRWLMTDERLGDRLWPAIARLPRGSGVIFRHYAAQIDERRRLFARVAAMARARGLVVVRAGSTRLGRGGDGVHNSRTANGLRTASAHDRRAAVAAVRAGVDAIFVSPVFATRSHPGQAALGPLRAAAIGRGLGVPVIALGGMDARAFRRLRGLGFAGWAAIDAWDRRAKRTG